MGTKLATELVKNFLAMRIFCDKCDVTAKIFYEEMVHWVILCSSTQKILLTKCFKCKF